MRALFAATAALLLSACAHPLEIRNLDRYSSLARGEPLERQTVIGVVTSAPDAETRRLVAGVGKALGRYSARVLQPYEPKAAPAEVVARISATPRYEGAGSNVLVNFPGLLVGAPAWNGYAYTVDYDIQVLLTRGWDNAKLDAWSMPVSLDVRHSSGMLIAPDYNPEVTAPTVRQAGEVVADHIARDIVRRLNTDGRLWKLEPPRDWTSPVPPPTIGPSIATTPMAPPVVAVPAPAHEPEPPVSAPVPAPAPAATPKAEAPAPALAPGATVQLRSGGVVRIRPLLAAEALALTSQTVKLNSRTSNASGEWWFVSAGGKSGWVLARDLQAPASVPAPAPVAPSAAAAAPPAASAPAPAAAAWAPGQSARLRAGAQARVRMAADAETAKGVDPAQPFTLKNRVKRDTGVWWYVATPVGSGWVLEADLRPADQRVH
jgi:hypothetical protein